MAMSHSEIDELARQPKESAQALAARLVELRSRGARIIDCIKYVFKNQGCSVAEAKDTVVNSSAWSDQKDDFMRHQWDMFEEFLAANKEAIKEIQMTISPDGTQMVVEMKQPGAKKDTGDLN
jgi:hypothetical protein